MGMFRSIREHFKEKSTARRYDEMAQAGLKYALEKTDYIVHGTLSSPWYRLRALRDIPAHGVRRGDAGGFVSGAGCVSQKGDCWVGEGSYVFQSGKVMDDALVDGGAQVKHGLAAGAAHVTGKTILNFSTVVFGNIVLKDAGEVNNGRPAWPHESKPSAAEIAAAFPPENEERTMRGLKDSGGTGDFKPLFEGYSQTARIGFGMFPNYTK